MEIGFNTDIIDLSVSLNALKLYNDGNYDEAIKHLLYILDVEPKNNNARLMLASCYYKANRFASSQKVFKHLRDRCGEDNALKAKAQEGFEAATAKIEQKASLPPRLA